MNRSERRFYIAKGDRHNGISVACALANIEITPVNPVANPLPRGRILDVKLGDLVFRGAAGRAAFSRVIGQAFDDKAGQVFCTANTLVGRNCPAEDEKVALLLQRDIGRSFQLYGNFWPDRALFTAGRERHKQRKTDGDEERSSQDRGHGKSKQTGKTHTWPSFRAWRARPSSFSTAERAVPPVAVRAFTEASRVT